MTLLDAKFRLRIQKQNNYSSILGKKRDFLSPVVLPEELFMSHLSELSLQYFIENRLTPFLWKIPSDGPFVHW